MVKMGKYVIRLIGIAVVLLFVGSVVNMALRTPLTKRWDIATRLYSMQTINKVFLFTESTNRTRTKEQIKLIVVHHDAYDSGGRLLEIYDLHRDKFGDIGYTFYINQTGDIVQLHNLETVTSHVQNHNTESLGVCVNGKGEMTPAQRNALIKLCYLLSLQLDIDVSNIKGHNELNPTECPGFDMNLLRKEIENFNINWAWTRPLLKKFFQL